MFKKLSILVACAALIATSTLYSVRSYATTGWYFVSVCSVPNANDCPWGPDPVFFGPYPSLESCNAARDQWAYGYFGTSPRSLSNCYEE